MQLEQLGEPCPNPERGTWTGTPIHVMTRRHLLAVLCACALGTAAAPLTADAQKPLPRVAYVYLFKEGPTAPFLEAFRDRMRENGWIDGQTVRIEARDALGDPERLAAIMRELVDSRVDVIVAMCTPEGKVAKRLTSTIPIVLASTGDPVAGGLVESFKPGWKRDRRVRDDGRPQREAPGDPQDGVSPCCAGHHLLESGKARQRGRSQGDGRCGPAARRNGCVAAGAHGRRARDRTR
jgi:hypothetical protein